MSRKPSLTQLGNSTHQNARTTRAKALKLLEIVKLQDRKTILIPQGYSEDYEKFKIKTRKK